MISDYDAKKIARHVCSMLMSDILPSLTETNSKVMDINEAAAYMGKSVKTLRNIGDKIDRVKTNGRWYYTQAGLNRYLLGMKGGEA